MLTLIALFTAAAGIQLVSWLVIGAGSSRSFRSRSSTSPGCEKRLSVIVAAKNGSETLPALYRALVAQSDDAFELVVVDDHSTDDTAPLVQALASEDRRVRLVENHGDGKKAALSTGVSEARHDILAFTDADCIPARDWVSEICRLHAENEECVVVGYGPYTRRSGLLNRLIRYETLHTALLSGTAIALNRPYMAVGRNLSYRKSMFKRVAGFEGSLDLLSGDDDLLIQSAAARGVKARFMASPSSFVYSDAPRRFDQWLKQKRRHLSAGRRYRRLPQIALLVYHLSAMLCWLAPFVIGWVGVGCLLCRLAPAQIVIARAGSILGEKGLAAPFVPLDLLFQLYLIAVAPVAWFRPPREW